MIHNLSWKTSYTGEIRNLEVFMYQAERELRNEYVNLEVKILQEAPGGSPIPAESFSKK